VNLVFLWLLLPMLAAVAVVEPALRGRAAARLAVATFAIATLEAAVGTLAPAVLHEWAGTEASNALFVSVSTGLAIGAVVPWPRRAWREWLPGLPLAVSLVAALVSVIQWGPLVLGVVLGVLPLLLASAFPRSASVSRRVESFGTPRTAWGIAVVAALLTLLEPLLLTLVSPLLPVVWRRGDDWRPGLTTLTWPIIATACAVLLGVLATTIAGSLLVRLGDFSLQAPTSLAAERLLAMLGVMVVIAMLSPWPLIGFGPGMVLGPAAVVLAHRFAVSLAPGGMPGWTTLVAMVLLVPAVGAALRGYWAHSLVCLAALLALDGVAWTAVAAAIATVAAMATAWQGNGNLLLGQRVSFPVARGTAVLAAVGLAVTPAVLLSDEVVLATLLALGLATAAARVARPVPAE
jgi:hypothetical protein